MLCFRFLSFPLSSNKDRGLHIFPIRTEKSSWLCSVPVNEEKNDNKEKIITATKKGAAVLDQWLPDDIKTQYHVLQVVSLDYIHIRVC